MRHGQGLLPVAFVHMPGAPPDNEVVINGHEETIQAIANEIVKFAADIVNSAHWYDAPLTADFTIF